MRSAYGVRYLGFALLVAALMLPVSAMGRELCGGDSPESVLSCMQRIYAALDSSAYADLLASDYVGTLVLGADNTTTWDRAEDLAMFRKLLRMDGLKSVTSAYSGYQVTGGSQTGTWVISKVAATATYHVVKNGKASTFDVTANLDIGVRGVATPSPHYEVMWIRQMP